MPSRFSKLEITALALYLIWTLCGLITVSLKINHETIDNINFKAFSERLFHLPLHKASLHWLLRWGDTIMIFLAALNAHLLAIRHWGVSQARRWAALVCIITGSVESCGTLTGIPFGHYVYTDVLGMKLMGVLPLAIPLAWLALLTSCLMLIRGLFPYASPISQTVATATLVTFIDWILEPYAVEIRGYWRWIDTEGNAVDFIPIQNYLSWWVLSATLVFFSPREILKSADPRPWLIPGAMVLLFITARLFT
ncbi:MAG: carotenoid biosynthesis protein [Methylacidiphilales bacterium]|nr:carotenoid biosynthesis protein [Candidatus Methylacidiphilales bacterium]MDW8348861.1 carotenoid biosynthesis protein [Verrucomicrobiae bacterium]